METKIEPRKKERNNIVRDIKTSMENTKAKRWVGGEKRIKRWLGGKKG